MLTRCVDCAVRLRAVDGLLSAIRLRHGMNLRDVREFLLLRCGFDFQKSSQLISELLEMKRITGSPSKYKILKQGGRRIE